MIDIDALEALYLERSDTLDASSYDVLGMIAEIRELRKDRNLLDGAADIRIVDGIGGVDIDEVTSDALDDDSTEEQWKLEWRQQFRLALRKAIDAAGEPKR